MTLPKNPYPKPPKPYPSPILKLWMQLLDIAASVLATPRDTEPHASFWTESERALLVTLRKRLVLTACAPAEEFIWVRGTHRRTCQPF